MRTVRRSRPDRTAVEAASAVLAAHVSHACRVELVRRLLLCGEAPTLYDVRVPDDAVARMPDVAVAASSAAARSVRHLAQMLSRLLSTRPLVRVVADPSATRVTCHGVRVEAASLPRLRAAEGERVHGMSGLGGAASEAVLTDVLTGRVRVARATGDSFGSDPAACSVVIHDPSVPPHAFDVCRGQGGWTLVPVAPGVMLDGRALSRPRPLHDGSLVTVGLVRLSVAV